MRPAAPTALATLVYKHQPWLLRRALRLCRNRADAEDLVQEVLLRFLASFGARRQSPNDSASASWLVFTLKNCFNDLHRRRQVRERATLDPAARPDLAIDPEPPEPALSDRIPTTALHAAIDSLSPRIRQAVAMHLAGRRNPDIAGELDIRSNAVARRLNLARTRLRQLLLPALERSVA